MKRQRGSRGRVQVILNPYIDGVDGSPSRFCHFTLGTSPGTHSAGGWVGTQSYSGLSGEEKKSLTPAEIRTPDRPAGDIIAAPTTLSLLNRNEVCFKEHPCAQSAHIMLSNYF